MLVIAAENIKSKGQTEGVVMSQAAPNIASMDEKKDAIALKIDKNVAHLILNRPEKLNSLNPALWDGLPRLIREIDEQAKARVIVISSTGKHFTAGMDLAVFAAPDSDSRGEMEEGRKRSAVMKTVMAFQSAVSSLEEARQPVLMAIQGGCIGGGVDFAAAADIRYASKDAFFCIQEINIGMTADVGTFPRLPKVMPEGLARELAYTGRRLYAEEAHRAGFITRLYETHEKMVAGVLEIAQEIAERSPLAVWGSKEMLNYGRDHATADTLKYLAAWQSGMFHFPDLKESFEAQQEKRKPSYKDLPPLKTKSLF